jgi:HSP20 family protein
MNSPRTSLPAARSDRRDPDAPYRRPHYDSEMHRDGLELRVYVPGVPASGIEITTSGPDLVLIARKRPGVRVNWSALQLERVQRDYRLKLRLGHGLDYTALQAALTDGILTVRLPRKAVADDRLARRRFQPASLAA